MHIFVLLFLRFLLGIYAKSGQIWTNLDKNGKCRQKFANLQAKSVVFVIITKQSAWKSLQTANGNHCKRFVRCEMKPDMQPGVELQIV